MAGKIKHTIDLIVERRSGGNPAFASSTKVKMIMKGIFPGRYTGDTEDDSVILEKLTNLVKELNIRLFKNTFLCKLHLNATKT